MKRILSGIRPTGKLHLGHLVGILNNWVRLQKEYECYFMVADLHALMSEYKNPAAINNYVRDNVAEWLAWGIDPEKCCIFVQSKIKEHLQLYFYLSLIAPLGRLYRVPTYKEQLKELQEKELNTLAFLGYPVLQAADILVYKAEAVPVGEDQLPHLELTRELARRFHFLYRSEIFLEPQPILTATPKLPGTDSRKMSKSYDNCIYLDEDEKRLREKVMNMFTDPLRIRLTDAGHPDTCNVAAFYRSLFPEKQGIHDRCVRAQLGCTQCKKELFELMNDLLAPHRKKKQELLRDPGYLDGLLEKGNERAGSTAGRTLEEVEQCLYQKAKCK